MYVLTASHCGHSLKFCAMGTGSPAPGVLSGRPDDVLVSAAVLAATVSFKISTDERRISAPEIEFASKSRFCNQVRRPISRRALGRRILASADDAGGARVAELPRACMLHRMRDGGRSRAGRRSGLSHNAPRPYQHPLPATPFRPRAKQSIGGWVKRLSIDRD